MFILTLDTLENTIEYYVYIDFRYIREYNRVLCLY